MKYSDCITTKETWKKIRCASMTTSVSNESDLRLLRTVRNQDTVPVTPPDLAMVTLQPYVTDARSGNAITSVLRRVWRERPEDTWHEEKPVLVRHSLFQGLTKARMVLLLSRNNDIVIRSTSGSSTSPEHCTSCIVSVSRKFVTDIPRSEKKEEKQITDFNLYILYNMWRNNTGSLIFVRLRSFILHFLVSTDFKNALSWTAIACCKKIKHKNIKIQLHLKINCLQDKRTQNSMCYSSHHAKHPDCCHTHHNEWQ